MAEVIIHTKKSTLAPIASVEEFIEDNEKVSFNMRGKYPVTYAKINFKISYTNFYSTFP